VWTISSPLLWQGAGVLAVLKRITPTLQGQVSTGSLHKFIPSLILEHKDELNRKIF
jgi:hypothetical protein